MGPNWATGPPTEWTTRTDPQRQNPQGARPPPPRDLRRWPLTAPCFSPPSLDPVPSPSLDAPFLGGGGLPGRQKRPPQNQKCTGASPHCLVVVWLCASDRGRGLGPGAVMLTELSYLVPDTAASEVTAITAAFTNGHRDSPKAEGTHRGRMGGWMGGGVVFCPTGKGHQIVGPLIDSNLFSQSAWPRGRKSEK